MYPRAVPGVDVSQGFSWRNFELALVDPSRPALTVGDVVAPKPLRRNH